MEMDFKEAHFDENFIKPCGKASKLTPMSDQDRISPYNIITVSTRQVMRMK